MLFITIAFDEKIKHLKSVLEKLEEMQLTVDIIFPKVWLASPFGDYSPKETNNILQDLLIENSKYNSILLKKLQQTTDNLIKVQSIKKKYGIISTSNFRN